MEAINNNQFPNDLDEGNRKRESDLLQKPKPKKANEEPEVNVRKKPGRKRLEVTESNTKKEKNRVAQRAWRERKEKYVLELEAKIAELENAKNKSENEKQQLKLIIEKLRSENTYLKNSTSFIFTPTKEAQLILEQNKLKNLKKNLKHSNPSLVNNNAHLSTQPTINPELANNNLLYSSNSNTEYIPSLPSNVINEPLLSEINPEVLDELNKYLNMQNPDVHTQDPSFNSALLAPESLMDSAHSPLPPELVTTPNPNLLHPNPNTHMYHMLSPLHKDDLMIPNNIEMNNTVPPPNPDLLFLMNGQNDPNKHLTQSLFNQQQHLNTVNPALVNPSTSETIPNTISSTLPNSTIDQNMLTMSMLNNIPVYGAMPPPTHPVPGMSNMDSNTLNTFQINNPAGLNKPMVPSVTYPSDPTKEEGNQPLMDEHLKNVFIELLRQKGQQQQQQNVDDYNQLIQHISRETYTNPITGMPSPSGNFIDKKQPSTPDALATVGAPYTPEDLDTVSNESGGLDFGHGNIKMEIRSRGIEIDEDDDEDDEENVEEEEEEEEEENEEEEEEVEEEVEEEENNDDNGEEENENEESTSREVPMEVMTSREIKVEENKRSNSIHSTLQFPAEQKPTKLNIPYSVFPRVTPETVDSFINDAKLSEEELECLCTALKDKATCKEKLKYISKNVEIEGWTMEKWKNGRINKEEKEMDKGEKEKEKQKEKETEDPDVSLKV